MAGWGKRDLRFWARWIWALGACCVAASHLGCHKEPGTPIAWETALDSALTRARAEHRPAMIDFTATWCAGCQELEKRTFVHPTVRQAASRFVAIKVDATVLDEAMQATFNRFDIAALPAIVFVDSQGTVRQSPRVTGFLEAPHFVELLGQVN